mmetsp:Transcript_85337/g.198403  ORF Transcript_85337/g.198403 Transcript_85337/m.198403 type:complete len:646 (+) Transcript_85337:57-1994(+)
MGTCPSCIGGKQGGSTQLLTCPKFVMGTCPSCASKQVGTALNAVFAIIASDGSEWKTGEQDFEEQVKQESTDQPVHVDPEQEAPTLASRENALERYSRSSSILRALESKDVILLKGSWLAAFAEQTGAVLPRRQELPSEAIWEVSDLFRTGSDGKRVLARKLVAVSYCWLDPAHPDPQGQQLQMLGSVADQLLLKREVAYQAGDHAEIEDLAEGGWYECEVLGPGEEEGTLHVRTLPTVDALAMGFGDVETPSVDPMHLRPMEGKRGAINDFAIFLDWCSLFQEPRSPGEAVRFKRSLADVELWYCHSLTWVWMLTKVPESPSIRPYSQRGWPFFERVLAEMITPDCKVLDLSRLSDACVDYDTTIKHCKAGRLPPLSPDDFQGVLKSKAFADDEDFRLLESRYWHTFSAVMAMGTKLSFRSMGWGAPEAAVLARSLRHCVHLIDLDLAQNRLDNEAACELAAALPFCSKLELIYLDRNEIGEHGAGELADALAQLPALRSVMLSGNPMCATGAAAISTALSNLQRLEVLDLSGVYIGDEGAEQLAGGLSGASSLKFVHLGGNDICGHGALHLASAFRQLTNLNSVYLWGNQLGDEGSLQILHALPRVQNVDFRWCGLSEEAKSQLEAAWVKRGRAASQLLMEDT